MFEVMGITKTPVLISMKVKSRLKQPIRMIHGMFHSKLRKCHQRRNVGMENFCRIIILKLLNLLSSVNILRNCVHCINTFLSFIQNVLNIFHETKIRSVCDKSYKVIMFYAT